MLNNIQIVLQPPLSFLKLIFLITILSLSLAQLIMGFGDIFFTIMLVFIGASLFCRSITELTYKLYLLIILLLLLQKCMQMVELCTNHVSGVEPDYYKMPAYSTRIVFGGLDILLLGFGLLILWRLYERLKLIIIIGRQGGVAEIPEEEF